MHKNICRLNNLVLKLCFIKVLSVYKLSVYELSIYEFNDCGEVGEWKTQQTKVSLQEGKGMREDNTNPGLQDFPEIDDKERR